MSIDHRHVLSFHCGWLILFAAVISVSALGSAAHAGPYNTAPIPGRVADPMDPPNTILNPELVSWAATVERYEPAPGVGGANVDPAKALGPVGGSAFGQTVSLGDLNAAEIAGGTPPGSITLRFVDRLFDGPGWDLAVFENAFGFFPPDDDKTFAELAYVEVSTDGLVFARFSSVSLTTPATLFLPDFGSGPLRNFAGIDITDVNNLAGVHDSLLGTPFDLADLAGAGPVIAGDVDLADIRFVRVIDIPGDGSFVDSLGNGILDAWTTTDVQFGNGGFDLDAIGARHAVPEPSALSLLFAASVVLVTRVTRAASRALTSPLAARSNRILDPQSLAPNS